ncbi:sensor histidine kinase [Xanthomonas massiliensis]|jgi:signal transduction histidine kinase|uniref:sensor histidine kinase n=1 Tax=Xanthomonas massiliensis TaxID=1720302 RepID=UPI000826E916|nr:sensor histidine kinase [Xanthomonas massiliensis]
MPTFSHTRILRLAGLFTWAVIAMPLLYVYWEPAEGAPLPGAGMVPLFAAYLGFGASYFWLTRGLDSGGHGRWYDRLMLLVLTGCALAVSYLHGSGLGSILMMVAAGVIPWLLSLPAGVAWLLVSQLAVLPVYRMMGFPPLDALMQSLLYGGFSMFVFVTSLVARRQTEAREEQRRLNAELRATRALLAESARVNERTRIARELHDLLGHHLTALSLNLEVAGHIAEGPALEHVRQAHALARILLTDVREAVSQLRENGSIDLAAALRPLVAGVPGLAVQLRMDEPLDVDDPERAHVLLRCTQEIITNVVRHAHARHLWIHVFRQDDAVLIEADDDGRGTDVLAAGNGLRGMRERLAQYGGRLDIRTRAGAGFHLRLSIPSGVPLLPAVPEGVM